MVIANIAISAVIMIFIFAWIIFMMTLDRKYKENATLILILTNLACVIVVLFIYKFIPFNPSSNEAFIGSFIGLALAIAVDTIIIKVVKHKKINNTEEEKQLEA